MLKNPVFFSLHCNTDIYNLMRLEIQFEIDYKLLY